MKWCCLSVLRPFDAHISADPVGQIARLVPEKGLAVVNSLKGQNNLFLLMCVLCHLPRDISFFSEWKEKPTEEACDGTCGITPKSGIRPPAQVIGFSSDQSLLYLFCLQFFPSDLTKASVVPGKS